MTRYARETQGLPLCRAAHGIKYPHGEYVRRAEPCVHAQSPARLEPSDTGVAVNKFGIIFALILSGCAGHPMDCALGVVYRDCAPGTAGYRNLVATYESDQARCDAYGFKSGTPDYARCIQTIDMGRTQNNQAALQALIAANANRQAAPAPYYAPINPTVNCTSNRIGNTVNTNCN